jgi:hypothetical protein
MTTRSNDSAGSDSSSVLPTSVRMLAPMAADLRATSSIMSGSWSIAQVCAKRSCSANVS